MSLLKRAAAASVLAAVAVSACASTGSTTPEVRLGHALAARDCGGCHAVEARGASPVRAAPAFRDLHRRYDVDGLAEALAEGISTGHPEMPELAYEPDEVLALLAYLKRF